MELFEQLRRGYEFGGKSLRGLSREFGEHRRMVREALASAIPRERKQAKRDSPQLEPVREFIDAILEADLKAPRKQRHTAHRIFGRIRQERPELLFQVIAERAERSTVLLTTNLPFSEWTQVFPNARLCKALLDRLTDRARIIETGLESYRFRRTLESRQKTKG